MKTRERIIHVSLDLFNEFGEPNVTTLQIADELDISPGNLYYHYKNKTEILVELFARYENEIKNLLDVPPDEDFSLEDYWLFLHLIFECIAKYRFLYKDLVNILQRYEKVRHKFKTILRMKTDSSHKICQSLQKQNILLVDHETLTTLCDNIVLISTYWPSYDMLNHIGTDRDINLARGIYQIMSLVSSYLSDPEKDLVIDMAKQYL